VPAIPGWLVGATGVANDGRIVVNAQLTDPATHQNFGRPFVLQPV
jgi:hypothetical protein